MTLMKKFNKKYKILLDYCIYMASRLLGSVTSVSYIQPAQSDYYFFFSLFSLSLSICHLCPFRFFFFFFFSNDRVRQHGPLYYHISRWSFGTVASCVVPHEARRRRILFVPTLFP